ncbi:MAG TPA: hypothetical protein H9745_11200 [Candidatus Agathobaculum stercoravium]|nr:hypothetical protein [Candidatus Agathobaculum stercoravium]
MSRALSGVINEIKEVLVSARTNVARQVNSELLTAYWNIGRIICEYEQSDPERADYINACPAKQCLCRRRAEQ